ncbi:hypothetical protein F511_02177 [Dorcoceras hygrometricum]|uniref:Replication protein A 70 kDa DNA-binding subunit B/D first OB fold domain-containing protein n=1 Tax=Dorcoceras hygrometricum TaxID=472368 RepID=A0A2Z7APC5_9LAMI|nr:hypothetical protein F511_02177 [Dorcoceras hygrometricum]
MQWTLKLRLVRCYELAAYGKNGDFTLECVLHDKEGDRIHASVKKPVLDRVKPILKEGHLFAIKNIIVAENRMKYKTTASKYKINFITKTHVCEIFDDSFPSMMFDFKSFTNVKNAEIDETMLFGEPTEFGNLVDKKVLFKVQVRQDQIRGFNGLYTVVKLNTDHNMVEKFCGETFESQESDVLSKLNISEAGDFKEVISSEDEVSTPVKSTKNEENSKGIMNETKRALTDEFSATAPNKKLKTIIKTEED